MFGLPKNGGSRDITLSAETVDLLRQHKRAQAELKMPNRTTYHDHGLVFAKEYGDLTNRADMIGLPLQANHLGERQFDPLIKAAKVKRITFPWHEAFGRDAAPAGRGTGPRRLEAARPCPGGNHPDTYAHVLPDTQKQAAATIGGLLHG